VIMPLWAGNSRVTRAPWEGALQSSEQLVACPPQFRSFSPKVLPQAAKNVAVDLGVRGLAFGDIYGAQSLECRKTR
jgi:hypothetical protein